MSPKETAAKLLTEAGVTVNGPATTDMQVHDDALYGRVISQGSLGLGEAYMDGWWDADDLEGFFAKVMGANLDEKIKANPALLWQLIRARLFNTQNLRRARKVGEKHYDVGNDLYARMLDSNMTYTCGYWKDAANLDEAQAAKYHLAAKKIGLKKGDRILDIGGGWGSFAVFAYKQYGAKTVAITISKQQAELGRTRVANMPGVEIRLQDYRQVNEPKGFDHIVSFGMIEHVGYKNYRHYMEIVRRNLKDDGLFLLHTIGNNKSVQTTDPWIAKYIFPNSMLPSVAQLGTSFEHLFVMEDWHNFGMDYNKTLLTWFANFEAAWSDLQKADPQKYINRFYRMWKYYLLSCAGLFRARKAQLWQIVLSKYGVSGGHTSVR